MLALYAGIVLSLSMAGLPVVGIHRSHGSSSRPQAMQPCGSAVYTEPPPLPIHLHVLWLQSRPGLPVSCGAPTARARQQHGVALCGTFALALDSSGDSEKASCHAAGHGQK